jgi:glycosyltransferase involved in cell wall biosynthesis
MKRWPRPLYVPAGAKRVLMVISELARGGAERQMLTLSDGLLRLGYQVEIFELAGNSGGNSSFAAELSMLGVKSRRASEFLDTTNLEYECPDDHSLRQFKPLLDHLNVTCLGIALDKAIRDFRPQIVHCWSDIANVIGGFVATVLGVPKVILGHRNVPACRMNVPGSTLYRRAYRDLMCDPKILNIGISKRNARAFEAWIGAEANTINVIYNGFPSYGSGSSSEEQKELCRESLGVPAAAATVGAVTRFASEKDPALWIETAKTIAKAREDVCFILAGYGQLSDQIRQSINDTGLGERFFLPGPVRNVSSVASAIDVFLMTSRFEATSNTLMEAQAAGIPVVAPMVGGIVEAVNNGVTGLVVPYRDAYKLADAVLRLLADPHWRRRAASAGPAFIAERFHLERMVKETIALYHTPPFPRGRELLTTLNIRGENSTEKLIADREIRDCLPAALNRTHVRSMQLPNSQTQIQRVRARTKSRFSTAHDARPSLEIDPTLLRAPARFISYAWGEKYLDRLLHFALPALLAPGNLPRVADTVPCELVLLIEQRERLRVGSHPVIARIRRLCPVTLLDLDDLISTPDKYGMSLTYALHRGMANIPEPVDNNFLFFLNADFVAANGSFQEALSQLMRGKQLVAAPSYSVVSELVEQELQRRIDPSAGALVIGKRQMAKLALRRLHNTVKGKTVNQTEFHLKQMDQFYWRLNGDTLLGHQMPAAIVAMRPERLIDEPNSYWDHGLMRELCPHAEPHVLGDSDDFMMIELRDRSVAEDQIARGAFQQKETGERMIGWVTPYQRDFAKYPLTLHAKDLPEEVERGRMKLATAVCATLSYSPEELPSHIDHPQWMYHLRGFTEARHRHLSSREEMLYADTSPSSTSPALRAWREWERLKHEYKHARAHLERIRAAHVDTRKLINDATHEAEIEREKIRKQFLAEVSSRPASRDASLSFWPEMETQFRKNVTSEHDKLLRKLREKYQRQFELIQTNLDCNIADIDKTLRSVNHQYERQIAELDAKAAGNIMEAQLKYEALLPKRVVSAQIPVVQVIRDAKSVKGSRHVFRRPRRTTRVWLNRSPLDALRRIVALEKTKGARNVLVIDDSPSFLEPIVADVPGIHAWMPGSGALSGNLRLAIEKNLKFGLCIWAAGAQELPHFSKLFYDIEFCLNEGGLVIGIHWDGRPVELTTEDVSVPEGTDTQIHIEDVSPVLARLERFRRDVTNIGAPAAMTRLLRSFIRSANRLGGNRTQSLPFRDWDLMEPAHFSAITVEARRLSSPTIGCSSQSDTQNTLPNSESRRSSVA